MKLRKRVFSALAIAGALGAPAATVQAQSDIGAKSTWELCNNVQGESSSLRDESAQELNRRGADCGFMQRADKAEQPTVESPLYQREPFFELEVDLNKRVEPR